jgi:hypothetical protein
MNMEVRRLKEEDYENTLVQWWTDWRWPEPPKKENLPHNGTCGLMVSENGVDICAGFLFLTNSKTAWVEYIISNIEVKDRATRNEAIDRLINGLSVLAKDQGYTNIFTSLQSVPLMKRYESCGYIKGSVGCTEMVKIL